MVVSPEVMSHLYAMAQQVMEVELKYYEKGEFGRRAMKMCFCFSYSKRKEERQGCRMAQDYSLFWHYQ